MIIGRKLEVILGLVYKMTNLEVYIFKSLHD